MISHFVCVRVTEVLKLYVPLEVLSNILCASVFCHKFLLASFTLSQIEVAGVELFVDSDQVVTDDLDTCCHDEHK